MGGLKCQGISNHNWCHDECRAGDIAYGIRIEAVRRFLNAYGGQQQITTIRFEGFGTEVGDRFVLNVTSMQGCTLACKSFSIPRYLRNATDEELWEYIKKCITESISINALSVEPILFDDDTFSFTITGPIGQTQNYAFIRYGSTAWGSSITVDQTSLPVGEIIPFGHVVHQLPGKDTWGCVKTPELEYPQEVFLGVSTNCGDRTITEGRKSPGYESNTRANGYCPHQYVDVLEEGAIHVKVDYYDPTVTTPLKHQQPIYNLSDPNYLPGAIGAMEVGGTLPAGWVEFPVAAKFETCSIPCAILHIDHGHDNSSP